jgi:hypothetical protein
LKIGKGTPISYRRAGRILSPLSYLYLAPGT